LLDATVWRVSFLMASPIRTCATLQRNSSSKSKTLIATYVRPRHSPISLRVAACGRMTVEIRIGARA